MSLILDALRKSEAERRRGQSPNLFSTAGLSSPVSRQRLRWWPVAIFVVLMLASGWVVWDGRTQRALDEVAPGDGSADQSADASEASDAGERSPVAPAPRQAPTNTPPPPAASTAVAAPSTPATVTPVTPSIAPPAAAPPPARTVASAPPASANPRAALPEIPATFSTSAPAVEAPAEEALPTLAVLDSITRGTLPPLKLSMHVWGQEPGKRFAIVDGQRVAEGSLLGNGVVEQIRRDGVVINVNGQRLLLPKP